MSKTPFFPKDSITLLNEAIKENKVTKIQFLGFVYQYRYNGVDCDVKLFSGKKEIKKEIEFNFFGIGCHIAEYFRPRIHNASNENSDVCMDGAYILKKFSKITPVELIDSEGKPITPESEFCVELGSDS